MVALPTCPPGTKQHDNDQSQQTNKHNLIWQKDLPNNWQLFSSSDTSPIVSFCKQGRHLIFGSTERWGVLDSDTGTQLWSVFDIDIDGHSSFNMKPPTVREVSMSSGNNNNYQCLLHTSRVCICINRKWHYYAGIRYIK